MPSYMSSASLQAMKRLGRGPQQDPSSTKSEKESSSSIDLHLVRHAAVSQLRLLRAPPSCGTSARTPWAWPGPESVLGHPGPGLGPRPGRCGLPASCRLSPAAVGCPPCVSGLFQDAVRSLGGVRSVRSLGGVRSVRSLGGVRSLVCRLCHNRGVGVVPLGTVTT